MSDKLNPNKGELVVSSTRSLPTKRSCLVKRGLQLIYEVKRQEIRVLSNLSTMGEEIEAFISELLSMIIQRKLGSKFALRVMFTSTPYCKELLKLAEGHVFDIFILILNNIIFPSEKVPAENRENNSLQLVTHLKTTYRKPVIALYGWPSDLSYADKAKVAGASFVFQTPPKSKELEEAFEKCLDILIRFDEVPLKRLKVSEGLTTT